MAPKTRIHYVGDPDELPSRLKGIFSGARSLTVADENTSSIYSKYFSLLPDVVTPAGEGAKSLSALQHLWSRLLEGGFSRKDCLVAFGGGAITDLAGLAASTYKRGMRLLFIPTTLIGMIDAAVGGKTAIDFGEIKNSIGTFYPPDDVLICPPLLSTLPDLELLSGKGELLKYALLSGRDPEDFLSDESLPETIRKCIEYKEAVVTEDLRDTGLRQVLNLGHTAGHALEALHLLSGKGTTPVPHGIAVAAGLVIEAYLSFAKGLLHQEALMSLARFVREAFPSVSFRCGDYDRLWAFALQDKKNAGGGTDRIAVTLIEASGKPLTGQTIDPKIWDEALDFYKDFYGV